MTGLSTRNYEEIISLLYRDKEIKPKTGQLLLALGELTGWCFQENQSHHPKRLRLSINRGAISCYCIDCETVSSCSAHWPNKKMLVSFL